MSLNRPRLRSFDDHFYLVIPGDDVGEMMRVELLGAKVFRFHNFFATVVPEILPGLFRVLVGRSVFDMTTSYSRPWDSLPEGTAADWAVTRTKECRCSGE
jgi:hypothetical protein